MNNVTNGGQSGRRTHAFALRLELGLPTQETCAAALTFAAIDRQDVEMLPAMAQKAWLDREDVVVAVYPSADAEEPDAHFLIWRALDKMRAIAIDPVESGKGKPLVLVDRDSDRQYQVNKRGILEEQMAEPAVRRARAKRRAEARLEATAVRVGPVANSSTWEASIVAIPRDASGLFTLAA